jgi:hypothetical protein
VGTNSMMHTCPHVSKLLLALPVFFSVGIIASCSSASTAPDSAAVVVATNTAPAEQPKATASRPESAATMTLFTPTAVAASSISSVPVDSPPIPAHTTVDWEDLPVIPTVSEHAREIYARGLAAGRDPHAFSKVGDCQNVPSMFLSIFDHDGFFTLGSEFEYLQPTIDWYSSSFSWESEAVRRGFNAASVVSPLWANPESCDPGESPLQCEIRIHNPSIAIVSLETWWAGKPENYEKYVRQILEGLIDENVLPILATKADNLEGDHRINQILVQLAEEYDIPLWNFWAAVQPLPDHGLLDDQFHLTFDVNNFDDPEVMKAAWPWRNLTALQALDAVRKAVSRP